jgi:hypothetical protein
MLLTNYVLKVLICSRYYSYAVISADVRELRLLVK